jgi:hypothetical protein
LNDTSLSDTKWQRLRCDKCPNGIDLVINVWDSTTNANISKDLAKEER